MGFTYSLQSEHPIFDPKNDRLGMKDFSKRIAQLLLDADPQNGLVLALNGPWGSGKSTLINFVSYYLRERGKGSVKIVRFDPWWLGGVGDISRQLFEEILAELEDDRFSPVRDALRKLASKLSYIPNAIIQTASDVVLNELSAPKSLYGLKNKVEEEIKKLEDPDFKVVVFLDDIDRLSPAECKELFRIVKAIGNLPRVVFVMAFDKEIVKSSLEATDPGTQVPDAAKYLEKFIQASFNIPTPDARVLDNLFLYKIKDYFPGIVRGYERSRYWEAVYYGGISFYLDSPRSIARLTGEVLSEYPFVKERVNEVDFIAIKTLAIFEPEVFETLRDNMDALIGAAKEQSIDANQWIAEVIFSWESQPHRSEAQNNAVKRILRLLFPKVNAASGGKRKTEEYLDLWAKEKRICHASFAKTYFAINERPSAVFYLDARDLFLLNLDVKERTARFEALLKNSDGTVSPKKFVSLCEQFETFCLENPAEPDSFQSNLMALSFYILDALNAHKAKNFWEKMELQRAFVRAAFAGMRKLEGDLLTPLFLGMFKEKHALLGGMWICIELGIHNERIESSSPLDALELPTESLLTLEKRLMKTLTDADVIEVPENFYPLRGLLEAWTVWSGSLDFAKHWVEELLNQGHVLWVLSEFVVSDAWAAKRLLHSKELTKYTDLQNIKAAIATLNKEKLSPHEKEALLLSYDL